MKSRNRPEAGKFAFRSELEAMGKVLETMTALHSDVKSKMELEQQSQQRKMHERRTKIQVLNSEFYQFKVDFSGFREECKNEWVTVYQELLAIMDTIVELYQIKIAKLEDKIQSQSTTIEELMKNSSHKASNRVITQGYQHEHQFETGHHQEAMQLSNSKKIKISDVISSYQSSILASNLCIEDMNADDTKLTLKPQNKTSSIQLDKNYDGSLGSYECFKEFFKSEVPEASQSNKRQDLTLTLAKYHNSKSDARINSSLDEKENLPSFISSCRKMSELQESKRDLSRTGRTKDRQATTASASSKFCELRRYLYNRKKT